MPAQVAYGGPRTDGLAIAALVVGILAIPCSIACLGVFLGPAAAIMGFISRQRVTASGGTLGGGGMAIAGLILGIIGFVISVLWFFFWVYGISHSSSITTTPLTSP
jgi:hypothetical protein